jgi:hypothetical protein
LKGAKRPPPNSTEVQAVYDDWVRRLQHPQFGLSCLFVCQNASAKLGIRLAPTISASIASKGLPGPAVAFAVAAMLRFLTPLGPQPRAHEGVFKGKMDAVPTGGAGGGPEEEEEAAYAGDLKADFGAGTYDFRDGDGAVPRLLYGELGGVGSLAVCVF